MSTAPSPSKFSCLLLAVAATATLALERAQPQAQPQLELETAKASLEKSSNFIAAAVINHTFIEKIEVAQKPISDFRTTSNTNSPTEALASHLGEIGARMYGAYWCPYCAQQKAMFGESFALIDDVECDARGENARPSLCISAGVQVYPTWEINGQFYPGVRSLDELAEMSGYTGSTDFDN